MSSLNVDKLNVTTGIELPSYTASNRPAGTVGLMIFNSDSGTVEIYDGSAWISTGQGGIEATGGIVSVSGNYKMHAFTQPGTSAFTVSSVPAGTTAEVLVVAGGGGGGGSYGGGGGGGGGGLVHHTSYPIAVGTYNVVVGDGGVCGVGTPGTNSSNDAQTHGRPGGDSYFDNIQAIGGGGGNECFYYFSIYKNGGSGGGGGDYWPATRAGNVPGGRAWTGGNALQGNNAGGTYYGNVGGSRASEDGGHGSPHEGAGGGGAGGTASGGASDTASNGGIGKQFNQFSPYGFPSGWFAGGGGGGYYTTGGGSANRSNNTTGGYYGGGGRGGSTGYSLYGEDGVNGSGGGGGGGSGNNTNPPAGRGGSGIVIVRYQI